MTPPEREAALARCDELIRMLRPLPHEDRMKICLYLEAHLKKAHVRRIGKRWRADMGTVKGHFQSRWTASVRYAREWHANHFKYDFDTTGKWL